MTDGGFRREKRGFEPPPWEREAFETLAAQSAERAEEQPAAVPPERVVAKTREAGEDELPPEAHAMFVTLQAEEQGTTALADTLGSWAGTAVAVLGFVLIVWGVFGTTQSKGKLAAVIASMSLMAMGAMFAATGGWLAYKSLKRQGVL